ncbi:MAG: TonB-dependent receptor [Gemmatimonadaceae bacterium]
MSFRASRGGLIALVTTAAALPFVTPSRAIRAQGVVSCAAKPDDDAGRATARASTRAWLAPLDRLVSLHTREVSLREALDRLAASADIRLSYSREALPLERRVCLDFDRVAVGQALEEILGGSDVEPVPAGGDQIALRPLAALTRRDESPGGQARTAQVLEGVVVTGSAEGRPQRGLAVAIGTLGYGDLALRDVRSYSQLFNGVVPGLWAWEQAPSAVIARYASIRGASSFGVSYPKVYIDGVEVANPLLTTELRPEMVERVEVIRGPQGAALYGSDAISGVVNITTRHEGSAGGGLDLRLHSTAGLSQTEYASRPPVAQDHSLTLHTGSSTRSASLALAGSQTGAYVTGADARRLSALATARAVGSRSILTGTARFAAADASSPLSPLITGAGSSPGGEIAGDLSNESLRQYTLGVTAAIIPGTRWRHSLILGADGYRLSGIPDDQAPIPSAADSVLRAARGGADRGTARLSSVLRLGGNRNVATTLTLAAEHSVLRQTVEEPVPPPSHHASYGQGRGDMGRSGPPGGYVNEDTTPERYGVPREVVAWRHNSGAVGQLNVALNDVVLLTGGLRVEHDDAFGTLDNLVTLPMIGAAVVRERGNITLKARAAYGKGVRAPSASPREAFWYGARRQVRTLGLEPEQQQGVEVGLEMYVGRSLSLQVTRFDQRATGLIQRVLLPTVSGRLAYQLQNVGEISNRGWEMQGTLGAGALSLAGALALVDSRVQTLAAGYLGDLRPGDRMLEVPSATAGLTLGFVSKRATMSLGVSRAADWINYDRLALYGSAARSELRGEELRSFWREYSGATRVRASISQRLSRGLSLVFTGDNLLDRQRGEPDNVTVVPGRTGMVGLRAQF